MPHMIVNGQRMHCEDSDDVAPVFSHRFATGSSMFSPQFRGVCRPVPVHDLG